MRYTKLDLALNLTIEFFDVIRYTLLSALAFVMLTGLCILFILFVIPPVFEVDLMQLLDVTHPDLIAAAVIELSARVALFTVIVFWVTYLPRIVAQYHAKNNTGVSHDHSS